MLMNNAYINDFNTVVKTYYKELEKCNPISRERETELIKKAKKNNLRAKNEILTSNLKFVFNVAKRYKGCGAPLEDLIAEGNMGLTKAIDKFDETKNVKFISYAVWWIRQSIQEFIKKKQVSDLHEVSEDDEFNKKISNNTLDDDEDEIIINSDVILSDEEEHRKKELDINRKKIIEHLLKKCDLRGRKIVEMYYGLNGYKPMTLGEIGDIYHISKERVRQICKKNLILFKNEILKNNVLLDIYR